jgi:hypothetical protein
MAAESRVKKPLWQRWHACPCGIGPIQRDLYSALTFRLSGCEQILYPRVPGTGGDFEGREPGLQAAYEHRIQRASARQPLPRSFGNPGARRASAEKSKPSDTRAALPQVGGSWKRGSRARNRKALEVGEVSGKWRHKRFWQGSGYFPVLTWDAYLTLCRMESGRCLVRPGGSPSTVTSFEWRPPVPKRCPHAG